MGETLSAFKFFAPVLAFGCVRWGLFGAAGEGRARERRPTSESRSTYVDRCMSTSFR